MSGVDKSKVNSTDDLLKYNKIVYIAGKFRPKEEGNQWQQTQNILRAMECALNIWQLGAVALCPHGNTYCFQGSLADNTFLQGDLLLLKRCDALFCVPGWEFSSGAKKEVEYAKREKIPTFTCYHELERWLQQE